jgi:putative ABC transport system permease protein
MFTSYLKIAIRSIFKFKGYSAINLFGLALGISSGVLILIHVLDETSFDQFHERGDRIYRVGTDMVDIKTGSANGSIETNGWPIGRLLEKDFPEVEKVVYIRNASNLAINHEGNRFEETLFYAGNEFFQLFSFPVLKGDAATALAKPYSIVLTEAMERKYFANESALGKTMVLADTLLFEVTGVMKDVPSQSHMQFDMLISFATYETMNTWFSYDGGWGNLNVRNYILLKEGVDKEDFFKKARPLYMTYVEEDMKKWGMYMYVAFEPMRQLYLNTTRGNGMGPVGSIDRLYLISGIAIFIILLACINFINLSTARSTYRAKEVGLRKVVGSSRFSLIRQFLGESALVTFIAFGLSLALMGVFLPSFNQLLGKSYTIEALLKPVVVAGVLGLVIVIALVAGYYPALILSSLQPAEVLKGQLKSSSRGVQLRRLLVVAQFLISAVLITGTMVVLRQLDFMQHRDLGFNGKQVVVLDMDKVTDRGGAGSDGRSAQVFKNELKKLPAVESVTFSNAVPGRPGWVGQWAFPADRPTGGSIGTEYMAIDEDYLQTLGIALIAGRNFDLDIPSEIEDGLIINETCARQMGWETPENALMKKIDSPSKHPAGTVIGVVRDYHEFGLQQSIYPMAMDFNPDRSRYFSVRFATSGTADLIPQLSTLWKKYYDGYDFKYFFLDENFERQYQAEKRLAKIFTIFSAIAVGIASIGLVGLVSFMVVSRTKEIGVRKILGANMFSVMQLLSREFILLVIVANVIALPLAWYFAGRWLESFAYRMTISPWLFVWTLFIALAITLITVSFQTIKAAMTDPVKSLRYE